MSKGAWDFRYGATAWMGPYSCPEAALTAAANEADLTPAEEDLVVALILTTCNTEKTLDALLAMKDDQSAVVITWQGRGWYIRLTRKADTVTA